MDVTSSKHTKSYEVVSVLQSINITVMIKCIIFLHIKNLRINLKSKILIKLYLRVIILSLIELLDEHGVD